MIQLTGRDKLPANLNTCLLYRFNCVQVGFHLHCAALLHHEHSSSPGLLAVLKGLTEEGIDHIPKDRRRADMRAKLDAKNIWKAVIKNYESVPEWEPVRLAQRECKAGICHRADAGRRIMNAWVLKNLPLGDRLVELITACASAYEITILCLFLNPGKKMGRRRSICRAPAAPRGMDTVCEPRRLLGGGIRVLSLASAMMAVLEPN